MLLKESKGNKMKKMIIIVIGATIFSLNAVSENLQENFIKTLYEHQRMFLTQGMRFKEKDLPSYEKFVEVVKPYVQRAEKELALFNYCAQDNCKTSEDQTLCTKYFKTLVEYIGYIFFDYIFRTGGGYYEGLQKFLPLIETFKDSIKSLNTIDPVKEWENTTQLFVEASEAYYKTLSWRLRFKLKLRLLEMWYS